MNNDTKQKIREALESAESEMRDLYFDHPERVRVREAIALIDAERDETKPVVRSFVLEVNTGNGWKAANTTESTKDIVQAIEADLEAVSRMKRGEVITLRSGDMTAHIRYSTISHPAFPERDPNKPAEQQGLFRKFIVQRTDGSDTPGGKHDGCRYFVLDLDHDQHAPAALRAYADACEATHPKLAADLRAEFGGTASPVLVGMSDEQIIELVARTACNSLNMTRMHEVGGKTQTIMDESGVIEFARALLAAASPAGEPDWSSRKTSPLMRWKQSRMPMSERLKIADDAVACSDSIIKNLNAQLAEKLAAEQAQNICVACEGRPTGDNSTCAVCGKQARVAREPMARADNLSDYDAAMVDYMRASAFYAGWNAGIAGDEKALAAMDDIGDRARNVIRTTPPATSQEPEWYTGISECGVRRFYHKDEVRPGEGYDERLYLGQPAAAPVQKTYSREEVQKWRDDIAHAAADMVQRSLSAFGDWSWLVDNIRGLADSPAQSPDQERDAELPPLPEPDTHCYDEDEKRDVWSYSADQMHEYALLAAQSKTEGVEK